MVRNESRSNQDLNAASEAALKALARRTNIIGGIYMKLAEIQEDKGPDEIEMFSDILWTWAGSPHGLISDIHRVLADWSEDEPEPAV